MMWLQHCQLKLIKIHVVLYDTIIKITQFPNGVQLFVVLELEFFHGLKLCSCPAHDLKLLLLAAVGTEAVPECLLCPYCLPETLSKLIQGPDPQRLPCSQRGKTGLCERLVSRGIVVNSDALLLYGIPVHLYIYFYLSMP